MLLTLSITFGTGQFNQGFTFALIIFVNLKLTSEFYLTAWHYWEGKPCVKHQKDTNGRTRMATFTESAMFEQKSALESVS